MDKMVLSIHNIDSLSSSYERIATSLRILRGYIAFLLVFIPLSAPAVFALLKIEFELPEVFLYFSVGFVFCFALAAFNFLMYHKISIGNQSVAKYSFISWCFSYWSAIKYWGHSDYFLPLTVWFLLKVTLLATIAIGLHEMAEASTANTLKTLFIHKKPIRESFYSVLGIVAPSDTILTRSIAVFTLVVFAFLFEGTAVYSYLTALDSLPSWVLILRERSQGNVIEGTEWIPDHSFLLVGNFIVFVSLAYFFAQLWYWLARKLRMWARKNLLQSARDVRQDDTRPPILFLRSFKDDQVSLKMARAPWYLRALDPGVEASTLEELLVQYFSYYGPVIALGNPMDRTPPIGAARDYLENEKWKDELLSHMYHASLIVIGIENTESVLWEIEQVKNYDYYDKTILFFPPALSNDVATLGKLANKLQIDLRDLTSRNPTKTKFDDDSPQAWSSPYHVLALGFGDPNECLILVSTRLTEIEYEVAIKRMIRSKGKLLQIQEPEIE